ncbi:hypothetical protein GCM10009583_09210 [Ornithinicoccus hortensis]
MPFVLIGVLAVAGCSGNDEPAPMPTPEDSLTTVTAVPPADDTEQTTDAPADDDPTTSAPDDAEETTETGDIESGATDAVYEYVSTLNELSEHPQSGVLEALSTADCETCRNFENGIDELVLNNHHTEGAIAELSDVDVLRLADNVQVSGRLNQLGARVLDNDDGVVRDSADPTSLNVMFVVVQEGDAWLVDKIQVAP